MMFLTRGWESVQSLLADKKQNFDSWNVNGNANNNANSSSQKQGFCIPAKCACMNLNCMVARCFMSTRKPEKADLLKRSWYGTLYLNKQQRGELDRQYGESKIVPTIFDLMAEGKSVSHAQSGDKRSHSQSKSPSPSPSHSASPSQTQRTSITRDSNNSNNRNSNNNNDNEIEIQFNDNEVDQKNVNDNTSKFCECFVDHDQDTWEGPTHSKNRLKCRCKKTTLPRDWQSRFKSVATGYVETPHGYLGRIDILGTESMLPEPKMQYIKQAVVPQSIMRKSEQAAEVPAENEQIIRVKIPEIYDAGGEPKHGHHKSRAPNYQTDKQRPKRHHHRHHTAKEE